MVCLTGCCCDLAAQSIINDIAVLFNVEQTLKNDSEA